MSILGVYNPLDIDVDHGDGVYIYSSDGTRYLGFYEWNRSYKFRSQLSSLLRALKLKQRKFGIAQICLRSQINKLLLIN